MKITWKCVSHETRRVIVKIVIIKTVNEEEFMRKPIYFRRNIPETFRKKQLVKYGKPWRLARMGEKCKYKLNSRDTLYQEKIHVFLNLL